MGPMRPGFVPIVAGLAIAAVAHVAVLPERWFVTVLGALFVILGTYLLIDGNQGK